MHVDSKLILKCMYCLFSSEVSSYLPSKLQRKKSMRKAAVKVLYEPCSLLLIS